MVFESLVVNLINRFLGDFVENLDKSQLDISIWNGQLFNNYFASADFILVSVTTFLLEISHVYRNSNV